MEYKKEIIVYDLETPKNCFLASFYLIEENKFCDFLINQYQNDLYQMLKFLENNKEKYYCGYNNIKFDAQVIEFIIRNYEKWFDLTNLEISNLIYRFASDEIDNQNYGLFSSFREYEFKYKQLDLPCIWHFFNENKRVSLKQLEFEMRAENIENLEFELTQEFNEKEIEDMVKYCHNDVLYTYNHLLYTIGETSHVLYKGKDKIKDRLIIKEEVGLDCLNWDDVKIGAEWNKKDYCNLTGKSENELKPKSVEHFYGKKFKQFFPKTVKFQTKELQNFIKEIGETTILAKKQEFKYKFNNDLTITIAKGGIHSNEKHRFIYPSENEEYIQNDIGSQYPNALRKYGIYPKHLGKSWNNMLVSKIQRRLDFKRLYKETKDPKYGSLQEMGKLSLNGGAYGRLNTKGDWQQDPCVMLKVTIGCQLEILMIVEALILKNYKIVSCNTDGWDSIVEKERLDDYFSTVEYYEELIGNKELGNVEYTVFEWIAQSSVNDYLAKKIGEYVKRVFYPAKPELKSKGDMEYIKELHKNSSFSIFPLAYQKYFNEGISIEDTINNHNDIFDFCARSNSGSTYYHEAYKNREQYKLPKLIRYYVSKEGVNIKKIVKQEIETNANDTNVQPAEKLKTICNYLPKEDYQKHLDNVDRKWYIEKANEMIISIEQGKKVTKSKIVDTNQLSLF